MAVVERVEAAGKIGMFAAVLLRLTSRSNQVTVENRSLSMLIQSLGKVFDDINGLLDKSLKLLIDEKQGVR